MPLQATSGAASYDAFGGGVPVEPNYIESCFSTYLYTGNGSTQTINNGIDLAGKGGLTWIKVRDYADSHRLFDTSRGVGKYLVTNGTFAETTNAASVTAFNSNGFSLGDFAGTNGTAFGSQYASWTFRKQPKFFDVVTWTGDGTTNRAIPHNLGSQPGFITCKKTSGVDAWQTAHRGNGTTGIYGFALNDSAQGYSWSDYNTYITSTVFYPDQLAGFMNTNGQTYVAYLFAHNAGGFGLTGTDNVISCGSFTTDGSGNATVNLGYEPQWILWKESDAPGNWNMSDTMRGLTASSAAQQLRANTSGAEISTNNPSINATGFSLFGTATGTFIYIAIRRGPMKVPTSGTSVFVPVARTANGAYTQINTTFAPDLVWTQARVNSGYSPSSIDKLRGPKKVLLQNDTSSELTSSAGYDVNNFNNTGVAVESQGQNSVINYSTESGINWFFQRAPSFFDEVCYTGTGTTLNVNHNLAVVPELIIIKSRSDALGWRVYAAPAGNTGYLVLNANDAFGTSSATWNNTSPTSSVFTVGTTGAVNSSGSTFVAYLFASVSGVSKIGSYTGTGATQTINCGFTGGARFVMVKRTDNLGSWWVWDTARGMVSGTDPRLALNSTSAETNADWVYTTSTGFQVVSTNSEVNASGGTYIYLAIA